MIPKDINCRLMPHIEDICRQLLPQGKRDGSEWRVANVDGGAGYSMGVHLTGDKAGIWADFATGQGGDILDLYMAVKGVPFVEALRWAKDYLGITDNKDYYKTAPLTVLKKTLPEKLDERVINWFARRGIPETTLAAYRVTSDGTRAVMPSYKDDNLVFIKYRDVAKPKEQAFSVEGGASPCLIGWQAVPQNAREVVITEGEIDAMSYHAQGIAGLSVPFGGGSGKKQQWIETDFDDLERFDTIYISMDMDKAGQEAIAAIVPRLGRHRCRIISLPKKDANEVLMGGGDLIGHLVKAKYMDPEELKVASSFLQDVHRIFEGAVEIVGDAMPWSKSEDQFRMRLGEMTVWQGINGHGKSLVLSHIFSHLIMGDHRACIASMEMRPVLLLRRAYQQIGGEQFPSPKYIDLIDAKCMNNLYIINIHGTAKVDKLLELFEYACLRFGCTHFLVDSLAKCGMAEDDYNGQKAFVEKLCDFAARNLVHVHLVAHARKREDENKAPNKMDVKGTGAITDMVDNVISVWRNKPKEEAIQKYSMGNKELPAELKDKPDCVLTVQKQRNFDWEGKIHLWLDRATHQYLEWGQTVAPMLEIEDESDGDRETMQDNRRTENEH